MESQQKLAARVAAAKQKARVKAGFHPAALFSSFPSYPYTLSAVGSIVLGSWSSRETCSVEFKRARP